MLISSLLPLLHPDRSNNRIRMVAAGSGIITTVAGNGTGTFAGDGGAATSASLNPYGVAVKGWNRRCDHVGWPKWRKRNGNIHLYEVSGFVVDL